MYFTDVKKKLRNGRFCSLSHFLITFRLDEAGNVAYFNVQREEFPL